MIRKVWRLKIVLNKTSHRGICCHQIIIYFIVRFMSRNILHCQQIDDKVLFPCVTYIYTVCCFFSWVVYFNFVFIYFFILFRKKMKTTSEYIYKTLFLNGENSDIKIKALGMSV